MRISLTRIALAGLLVIVPGLAAAQQPAGKPDAGKTSSMARGDAKFMREAAAGSMAEVELGKLAEQKAASDSVKDFGKRMAADHGKAADELRQLAQQKGVTLPTDLDRGHRRAVDRLGKLSGADFDREYMKEMVKDHDKDVKAFQKEADSGKDSDVKAWAAKTLPTLKEHQAQAKQVHASTTGKGSPAASPRQK
jgi:putative membrane protein